MSALFSLVAGRNTLHTCKRIIAIRWKHIEGVEGTSYSRKISYSILS